MPETVPKVLLPVATGTAPPELKIVEQPELAQVIPALVLEYDQAPAVAQAQIPIAVRVLIAAQALAAQVRRVNSGYERDSQSPFSLYAANFIYLIHPIHFAPHK